MRMELQRRIIPSKIVTLFSLSVPSNLRKEAKGIKLCKKRKKFDEGEKLEKEKKLPERLFHCL